MGAKLEFNISKDKSKAKYLQKICIKRMKLPTGVIDKLITNGNIITVGDLLETSSLDLFNILDSDYMLYKKTKDSLKKYGIELFAHTSAQAQKVKNKYYHLPFTNKNYSEIKTNSRVFAEESEIQF